MEPGDLLIFHPKTLHGSGGNYNLHRQRRALAFRWLGDDVTYAPTPYTMPFPVSNLVAGDAVAPPSFARVIPA
jgi:ectoine hydroxylase-related dioxygenase (phytanoyl-CoA dioxygenase family)